MSTIHNAIKYGSQILRAFSRQVGLDENEEGTVRLGESLTPILDAWAIPEMAFLRGERLCAYRRNVAAGGAGTSAAVALCNPANFKILIVCEMIHSGVVAANGQAGLYAISDATAIANLGNSSQGFVRDHRGQQRISEGVIRYSNTPVGLPADSDVLEVIGTSSLESREFRSLPVIIPPGRALMVWNETVAQAIAPSFRWREHRLQPGELGT